MLITGIHQVMEMLRGAALLYLDALVPRYRIGQAQFIRSHGYRRPDGSVLC